MHLYNQAELCRVGENIQNKQKCPRFAMLNYKVLYHMIDNHLVLGQNIP